MIYMLGLLQLWKLYIVDCFNIQWSQCPCWKLASTCLNRTTINHVPHHWNLSRTTSILFFIIKHLDDVNFTTLFSINVPSSFNKSLKDPFFWSNSMLALKGQFFNIMMSLSSFQLPAYIFVVMSKLQLCWNCVLFLFVILGY